MTKSAKFCVIYRFKVRPGKEEIFKEGWRRMTITIRETRGGLGSRLHLADDGWWVAYAQWPDRATWESSQQRSESPDDRAGELMVLAVESRKPPNLLQPEIDLLVKE